MNIFNLFVCLFFTTWFIYFIFSLYCTCQSLLHEKLAVPVCSVTMETITELVLILRKAPKRDDNVTTFEVIRTDSFMISELIYVFILNRHQTERVLLERLSCCFLEYLYDRSLHHLNTSGKTNMLVCGTLRTTGSTYCVLQIKSEN